MIIKSDKSSFQSYLTDSSNYKGNAEKLFIPESIQELQELVIDCNRKKTKLTVSGNGTGLTGGRVPDNGFIISLEKFNEILNLDEKNKTVTVQPAVLLNDLQSFVEQKNLFYPPDPTERNSFIGGNIATNASGARTFKYGPTRDYVNKLKVIIPNGEILELDRNINDRSFKFLKNFNINKPLTSKNASGFFCEENLHLIDLFIGSEGLLGIIIEAELKLIDLPKEVFSAVAFFDSENDALNFIEESKTLSFNNQSIIGARGLEFFDEHSLIFLSKDFPNIPNSAKAAVWFEQEIIGNEDEIFENWSFLLEKFNYSADSAWFASDPKDYEKFKDFRHSISWKVNEYIAQKNFKKVGTDVAVPDKDFHDFYFWCKKLVSDSNLHFVSYGHFGNSHLHLNMLPKSDAEYKTAKENYYLICKKTVELNGTISAEHGIGKLKKEYFELMYSEEEILQMAKIKKHFDENLILNIGNIIDPRFYEMV